MRVIQVGIGGMGNTWIGAVQASSDVEYAALVEIDEGIADAQRMRHALGDVPVFRTLPEALSSVEADGVINVTPPQFHEDVSVASLEAGIPVLSEKPLADTQESARRIVDTANATGVLHMVAQNYRYRRPIQTLKQTLTSGQMGTVGSVAVEFFRGPRFGGFREEMAYPLIIDMSIHHFDLMRYLLANDPVSVFGTSWNPSWSWFAGDASAAVTLTFADDIVVTYNGSWCSQARETSWNANWRFECSEGVVIMEDDAVFTQTTGEAAVPVAPVEMEREGQSYLLEEFRGGVAGDVEVETTCQDNIRSLNIVFDVVTSFESGQVVSSSP
jgi:predicted dehydrogenase